LDSVMAGSRIWTVTGTTGRISEKGILLKN
jgi:hypothetical protein